MNPPMMDVSALVPRLDGVERESRRSSLTGAFWLVGLAVLMLVATIPRAFAIEFTNLRSSWDEHRFDLGGDMRLVPREKEEESKQFRYTIKVRFPHIEGAIAAPADHLNRMVSGVVGKKLEEFRREAKDTYREFKNDQDRHIRSSLDIDYSIEAITRDFISIRFLVYDYSGGGAHGILYQFVLNYDLKGDKVLSLGDLFKPRANYLKIISDWCINSLKERRPVDDEHIKSGASERLENYERWNLTPKGLLITFDPYQVASYAEGFQEVIVPFLVLRDIMKPVGPIIFDKDGKAFWQVR